MSTYKVYFSTFTVNMYWIEKKMFISHGINIDEWINQEVGV
jgi:hypothetical protein